VISQNYFWNKSLLFYILLTLHLNIFILISTNVMQ